MSMSRKLRKKLAAALAMAILGTGTAYAADMPTGGSVVTGTVTGFSANPDSGATITAGSDAMINWTGFDIGAGKILNFDTGNGFVLLNQVTGGQMSHIYGTLNDIGSGHLILANPTGIIFHQGSVINAGYLTLSTMQNLDVTGFNKLTSGGWGPEITTNGGIVAFEGADNPAVINVRNYLGVLAGSIMLDDHVQLQSTHSQVDLTATDKGQYSLLMGNRSFYSNGITYNSTSNVVKIGSNTVLNVDGKSYNQISILGGQVAIGDYASLNTGSDANMSSVLIQAVATKNDSASDFDSRYTASSENLIKMRLVNFSNGSFKLVGGNLVGEVESFQSNFKQVGGSTPTTPEPTTPEPTTPEPTTPEPTTPEPTTPEPTTPEPTTTEPTTPEPTTPEPTTPEPTTPEPTPSTSSGKITPEQALALQNALDAQRANDAAAKALQDALDREQSVNGSPDHITITTGGADSGIKMFEPITSVQEGTARSRSLARQYTQAVETGDKDKASQLKDELVQVNEALKELKAREQEPKDEQDAREKALKDAQEAARKVEEARLKAERAARDYLNALKTGDPAIIAAYKERLQEANDAYLAARQNEEAQINNAINPYTIGGVYNNLTGTPEPGQQGGEQQDNSAESGGFPSLSELLRQYQEQQQQQQSGETTIVTVGEPQESDALKRINDIIGKELIERETNARNKLVKAKTSEERQQAMKELDEIHRQETEKVNEALKKAKVAELEQKYNDLNKEFWILEKDSSQASKDILDAKERGASLEEIDRLRTKFDVLSDEKGRILEERDAAEAKLEAAREAAMTPAEKVSNLEQKYNDLNKEFWTLEKDSSQASKDILDAKERGASLEEIDRLRTKFDVLSDEKGRILEERDAVEAKLEAARAQQAEQQNQGQQGEPYGHYQYKVEYKLGDNQDDGSYRVNVPQDQKQREQYEAILREQGNGDAQTGASQPPYQGLKSEMDGPDLEKAGPITEPMLSGEGTQGEQRTSVETGGQSGLNIGGERPVVETETTRPRTGTSQQSMQDKAPTLEEKSAQQAAKDAAVKAAQEKLDQSRKDGFDKYAALQKAQYDLSLAEEKAEQAAQDYLLALKSGDQYTIDAFKEELQKANDAMLEAKRNEAAAQQGLKEAGANIDRARTELNNAQNNVNNSSTAGGESQQTQQTVGQPSQSQQTEKHSTVENGGQSGLNIGGERPVVETETTRLRTGASQQPAQEKTSALEQKVDDLRKQFWASVKDRDQASRDYRDAQERGASQEELDRLKARYDELEKQKDSNLAEYRAAKAEQKVDDLTKQYWESVKDRDQAGRDYREAQERGASQEELDRLKARYDELEKQKDNNLAEYRASKAEMQSAREAADAAKAQQSAQQNG